MEKFDFDKFTTKEEIESSEVETIGDLDKQLKFEEECNQEAEKLELNLQEFRNEIESYGGVDKFKEAMDKRYEGKESRAETAGEHIIYSHAKEADKSLVLAMVAGLAVALGILIGGDGLESLSKSIGDKEIIESYVTALSGISLGSIAGIQAVKEGMKIRKSNIEAKIQKLKLKMTGAIDNSNKDITFD